MRSHRIASIPGDGIGNEVVPAAIRVIDRLGSLFEFSCEWVEFGWGCDYFLENGAMMPSDGLELLRPFEAIFLGAVGSPGVPDHVSLWGLLIPIRRSFHQYVNLRPIRSFTGVRTPLRADLAENVDLVIIRENNEGEYSEVGGRLYRGTEDELAVQESLFTRRGIERVVSFAFELARTRHQSVMSATKSNGIIHTMPFWDEVVEQIASKFSDVHCEKMHIDALAAQFVLNPARFDVVVGSNLFGDILSDLAAAIAGSIGIAPSANLNPSGEYPSMFEPVHGSAPDIAGLGIANPIGQIWSGALMLRHIGEQAAADALEGALSKVLNEGTCMTRDLGGSASTTEATDAVIAALA